MPPQPKLKTLAVTVTAESTLAFVLHPNVNTFLRVGEYVLVCMTCCRVDMLRCLPFGKYFILIFWCARNFVRLRNRKNRKMFDKLIKCEFNNRNSNTLEISLICNMYMCGFAYTAA